MYELGVGAAFCIWIGSLVWLVVSLNSQLERNFNKVGLRLSWLTLSPKPMSNNYRQRSFARKLSKSLIIFSLGFVGVLFSWLSVVFFIGSFIYSHLKDAGAPQEIKEFRWRMRNMDLTFDDVAQGLALVSGGKTSVEHLKRQLWDQMVERGNA